MKEYPSFSEESVHHVIERIQEHHGGDDFTSNINNSSSGQLSMLAECISVSIKDGKVCLKLPLGIGSVCIPVPIRYDGDVAQACLHINTKFGIPVGVTVKISVAGVVIVKKTFGLG